MTIGASLFLIAVGAILAFAVEITTSAIDIQLIGVILMIAGAVGLLIGLFMLANRRSVVSTQRTVADVDDPLNRRL